MSAYCDEHGNWDDCIDKRWEQRQRDVQVGDPATQCYPDDRYPYVVVAVTGKTITLAPVDEMSLDIDRGESGATRGGWPLNDRVNSPNQVLRPKDGGRIKAHWSEKKRGWYHAKTTPITIGFARYLRDWAR